MEVVLDSVDVASVSACTAAITTEAAANIYDSTLASFNSGATCSKEADVNGYAGYSTFRMKFGNILGSNSNTYTWDTTEAITFTLGFTGLSSLPKEVFIPLIVPVINGNVDDANNLGGGGPVVEIT